MISSARALSRVPHAQFASSSFENPNVVASLRKFRYDSPTAKQQVDDVTVAHGKKKSKKSRTWKLEKFVGEKRLLPMQQTNTEIRGLEKELQNMFTGLRSLRTTFRGPYRVQTKHNSELKKGHPHLIVDSQESSMEGQGTKVAYGAQDIPNVWLRDNCQCATCVHVDTKQRLLDTFSIPQDIAISSGSETVDSIDIEWSDGHKSQYSKQFLLQAAQPVDRRYRVRQGCIDLSLWDSTIASAPPTLKYGHHSSGAVSIPALLRKIRKYGFCYITNVPPTPEATEALLRSISFIRETHYGGFYDFTADLASKDTAYTNIALEAHTDTSYFSDPAGLQAFHLLGHSDGEGGASLLVDGFKVAEDLFKQDPAAYEVLATTNIHSHASGNSGISIQPYRGFPVLEHDTATGNLLQVRWNSSDRAGIELPLSEVGRWYDAARKWDALLKKSHNEYWEQLKPGTVVIFDNWRVLHGRSQFTGKRRICGGYINRDDWISKFKMESFGEEEVLGRLASG